MEVSSNNPYTYTLSTNYINGLVFDYIETYSFQRGNEVVNYDPSSFQREIEIRNEDQDLIYEQGKWHESRQKTNVFRKDETIVQRLIAILQTEVREVPAWMCAPIYRDAIVFYNNAHEIVSALNVWSVASTWLLHHFIISMQTKKRIV